MHGVSTKIKNKEKKRQYFIRMDFLSVIRNLHLAKGILLLRKVFKNVFENF